MQANEEARKKIPPATAKNGSSPSSNDLTHYINRREFRFRADSPDCRRLVDQLMDFPIAEHDDGPDALEIGVRLPVYLKSQR